MKADHRGTYPADQYGRYIGEPEFNRTNGGSVSTNGHKTGLTQGYLAGHKGQIEAEGHNDMNARNRDN